MRALQLRWISLPKGIPDANLVETIFSDVQLMVLDNSNDADVRATQSRIRRHLRARSQCKECWVKVPYLPNSESPLVTDSDICDTTVKYSNNERGIFTMSVSDSDV